MRKLILGILVMFLISCVEDQELFIPNQITGPQAYLKTILPSQSLSRSINVSQSHEIITDNETHIIIPEGILQDESITNDFSVNFIELESYGDYILHNVEHFSDQEAINVIYSFYIALESDEEIQALANDAFIEVLIPHDELMETVRAGKGDFESGRLNWNYTSSSLNDRLEYLEWDVSEGNESYRTEKGYRLKLNSPGWYSIISISDKTYEHHSVCLQFDKMFTSENTLCYMLSESSMYMSQVSMQDDGVSCSEYLPFYEGLEYKLVSISEIDGELYYYKGLVDKNSGAISVNPQRISSEDLKKELTTL